MKISVLIENTTNNNLIAEHGLSLFIEYDNKRILLDSGSSDNFIKNANKMNIDLKKIDICVLSHGHYDHCGGFKALFDLNDDLMLYLRKEALNQYYSANGAMHLIGIPDDILEYKNRFILINKNIQIANGIYLIGHDDSNFSKIGEKTKLYRLFENNLVFDDFMHEQSLVFDTSDGLIIFNSCSHIGITNIINEVKKYFNKPIYAYIGGLHMKGNINNEEICIFNDDEINDLCDTINKENIRYIYSGHCTGIVGYNKLKKVLGDKLDKLYTGKIFEL